MFQRTFARRADAIALFRRRQQIQNMVGNGFRAVANQNILVDIVLSAELACGEHTTGVPIAIASSTLFWMPTP